MRNALAIAQKELKSYFASPVAYVVVGMFALLYGWFYVNHLYYFMDISLRSGQFGGPQNMNVNQILIRGLMGNTAILLLFIMPVVTARIYSEETRSGTIELLLTSPVTDIEIMVGKFLGALFLFALMLLVTAAELALLFRYGSPEWKPIVTGYLGLLLMGGSFISLGLFISSLTKSQVAAALATFSVFLLLWVITWIGNAGGPTVAAVTQYLSIIDHFEDFSKGVIDTTHVIYYLSFITFGLFLTLKSVDSERWRG